MCSLCLGLVQVASPLAWLCRVAWLVLCGAPSQVLAWVGLPVYSRLPVFSLTMGWVFQVVKFILRFTPLHSFASESAFTIHTITAACEAAAVLLAASKDWDNRQADIAMLAAAGREADLREQLLPQGLQNLRGVLTAFGASVREAAALAQRGLDGVNRTIHRLDRLMRPWA